jgi:hypothetical protein
LALLGEEAWWVFGLRGPRTILTIHTAAQPYLEHELAGLDASGPKVAREKAEQLKAGSHSRVVQADLMRNPDCRVTLDPPADIQPLSAFAVGLAGVLNGDSSRFRRFIWEVFAEVDDWEYFQSTVEQTCEYGGREGVIYWQHGNGDLRKLAEELRERLHDADRRGNQAWGRSGVIVSSMRHTPCIIYTGDLFDNNAALILPHDPANLPAIWCFCKSPEFHDAVRRIDQKVNVTNATLVKVPFDLDHWQQAAAEEYPNGLPATHSDDPTQWLFKGHPNGSTDPLQVAVARLLGYRWPDQEPDGLDRLADQDGIVCIPAVRTEAPAADRLLELLRAAYSPPLAPPFQGGEGYKAQGGGKGEVPSGG